MNLLILKLVVFQPDNNFLTLLPCPTVNNSCGLLQKFTVSHRVLVLVTKELHELPLEGVLGALLGHAGHEERAVGSIHNVRRDYWG